MRVLLALACACLSSCGEGTGIDEADRPTSIVLFVVDTLRADHLGAYGYERDTSPCLDAFANEGIVFERVLAQSTWTKPATASIHTGRYPSEHGATAIQAIIDPSARTIAESLRDAGYATRAFVTNGMVVGGAVGFGRGFDEYTLYTDPPEDLGYQRAEPVIDDALAWLDEADRDRPFFLYIHLLDPHAPYDPLPPFDRLFAGEYEGAVDGYSFKELAGRDLSDEDLAHLIDLYDGEIAYVDQQFGRFIDGLREKGFFDDTAILFLSDHGEEFGERGGMQHGPTMHQEVVGVPLVCRFPQWPESARGRRVGHLVQQVDVLPTILHAAGIERSGGLPGRSLLLDALIEPDAPRFGFSEVDQNGVVRKCVVHDGWKYIRTLGSDADERLYHMNADLGEQSDLISTEKERSMLLGTRLDAFTNSVSTGYTLLFHNDSDEIANVVAAALTAQRPLERIQMTQHEGVPLPGADGPIQWELIVGANDSAYLTRVHYRTAPGDWDGLMFTADDSETRCTVSVHVNGKPVPIYVGAEARTPWDEVELFLREGEPVLGHEQPQPVEHAGGVTAYLWKSAGAANATAELDDAVWKQLEALGYTD